MASLAYAHGYMGLLPVCQSTEYQVNYVRGACDFARDCLKGK